LNESKRNNETNKQKEGKASIRLRLSHQCHIARQKKAKKDMNVDIQHAEEEFLPRFVALCGEGSHRHADTQRKAEKGERTELDNWLSYIQRIYVIELTNG
jgi:hypothetical protein